MFRRLVYKVLDDAAYLLLLARLRLHDWSVGPEPETPTDRAIREEGEQVRKAFPEVDFNNPMSRRKVQR
jgi:hypothetical protein